MKLKVGDELELDGVRSVVVAMSATSVSIRPVDGGTSVEYLRAELVRRGGVVLDDIDGATRAGSDLAILAQLPTDQRAEAEFFLGHIREVTSAIRAKDARPVAEIVEAKRAELASLGWEMSERTLRRKITAFRQRGIVGLVDQRAMRPTGTHRVDPRVISALSAVMEEQDSMPTGTMTRLRVLTIRLLDQRHGEGAVPIPSASTFERLIEQLDAGRGTTRSARTRASLANSPDRMFEPMAVSQPGEQVQIDSTRMDLLVTLENGVVDRPDLTVMLDVATRTIVSAVLRPGSTKSVDLVVALARALVPYDLRPGGLSPVRRLTDAGLDVDKLLPEDRLEWHMMRVPYIIPDTITTDRGRQYVSEHFRTACEQLGISLNLAASYTPTDKGKVERTFRSINDGFTQYLKGHTGRGVEFRGAEPDPKTLHSLVEVQALLDEWIAAVWQNTPRNALRHPLGGNKGLSPNEMYAAYCEVLPKDLPWPFDSDTYIGLLPSELRTIQRDGVSFGRRRYDSPGLAAVRRTSSGQPGAGGKWRIHYDPYNIQTVWVSVDGSWLALHWQHAGTTGPFSDAVWAATRKPGFFDSREATERAAAIDAKRILDQAATGRTPESLAAGRSQTVARDAMRQLAPAVPAEPVEPEEVPQPEEEADDAETHVEPSPPRGFPVLDIDSEINRRS